MDQLPADSKPFYSNFLPDSFGVCSSGPYQKGLVMEDWAPVAIDIIDFTGLINSIDAPMV